MSHPNERSEMSFDRSQHELEQLRYYCMGPDAAKATLRTQLESSDKQITYYRRLCREQENTIKDLRSRLEKAEAENVALRDERDAQVSDGKASRDSWLALLGETVAAKARPAKRYRAPTVKSVSDEETGCMETRESQQESTNHVLEVFLTFVSTTDSRMNKREAVYVRQQQSLRDVLGPQVFELFPTDAMAFVYKAQQIRDVGQTAAEVSTLPTHTFSGRVS